MHGIAVMLHQLCGDKAGAATLTAAIGKTINVVHLGDDDVLHFEFTDGSRIGFWDNGQSCCEVRYMRTDDDLSTFSGATFQGAEIKEAPSVEDRWGDHEIQFLEIQTSKGCFTMASHNEHNGYYGGFAINVRAE